MYSKVLKYWHCYELPLLLVTFVGPGGNYNRVSSVYCLTYCEWLYDHCTLMCVQHGLHDFVFIALALTMNC